MDDVWHFEKLYAEKKRKIYENLGLQKLQLELDKERQQSHNNVDLLMKGETLRERMMLDAILGKFPPTA